MKTTLTVLLLLAFSLTLGQAGDHYLLSQITLKGSKYFASEFLLNSAGWDKPGAYSDSKIEAGIARILALYQNSGYPYCQVKVEKLDLLVNQKVSLCLSISEGPLVKVSHVNFDGAPEFLARVLLKEINFQPGELYSSQKWDQRIRALSSLSSLEKVSGYQLQTGSSFDSASVRVELKEKKNNNLSGVLGYAPGRARTSGFWSGSLSLGFSNFLSGVRDFGIEWHKKDQNSFLLKFDFKEQWFLGTPFSLGVSFLQSQTDSSYSQLEGELETGWRARSNLSIWSSWGWERVFQKQYLSLSFPSSRKIWLGAGGRWNRTDHTSNPGSGFQLELESRLAFWQNSDSSQVFTAAGSSKLLKTEGTISYYLPLFSNQTLAFQVSYLGLSGGEGAVSPAELFKLGGWGSLRGYLTGEFWAQEAFLTKLEYRFLLKEESRFYLFADMAEFRQGYLNEVRALNYRPNSKLGYGVGFWLSSRLGTLNLDLGLGQRDSFQDLKVHIGMKNQF